jgi:hypothetical protein
VAAKENAVAATMGCTPRPRLLALAWIFLAAWNPAVTVIGGWEEGVEVGRGGRAQASVVAGSGSEDGDAAAAGYDDGIRAAAEGGGRDRPLHNGDEDEEDEEEDCGDDGTTCVSSVRGYDPLIDDSDEDGGGGGEPWHDERPETCADNEFWTLEWKTLQVFRSKYQHVEFCQDPRNDDMCLDVDSIIQICASYRPHYHVRV